MAFDKLLKGDRLHVEAVGDLKTEVRLISVDKRSVFTSSHIITPKKPVTSLPETETSACTDLLKVCGTFCVFDSKET